MPPQEFRTAGVDLASQNNRTALAEISWSPAGAVLEPVRLGVDNDAIVAAAQRVRLVGIDCPIGWPAAFTDLVIAARLGTVTPDAGADDDARRPLAYRLTDHVVRARTGRWPLSVSADRIAYPAMRCAGLLARIAATGVPVRRDGLGSRVAEVYPAAALRIWQLPTPGYKTDRAARTELVKALAAQAQWLDWGGQEQACIDSDDVLDAVVCALVAGSVAAGRTEEPAPDQLALAQEEGWIHLPQGGFLGSSDSCASVSAGGAHAWQTDPSPSADATVAAAWVSAWPPPAQVQVTRASDPVWPPGPASDATT